MEVGHAPVSRLSRLLDRASLLVIVILKLLNKEIIIK